MATYNWKYKSGDPLPNGEFVNISADNVRPNNCSYVSLFGNDNIGNGSRQKPYKTISKAIQNAGITILSSGTYRESIINAYNKTIIGDGDVVIDGYTLSSNLTAGDFIVYNVKIKNYSFTGGIPVKIENCIINDCIISTFQRQNYKNTIFKNCTIFPLNEEQNMYGCTLVNCRINRRQYTDLSLNQNNIYYMCNVLFEKINSSYTFIEDFSLFYHCNFKKNLGSEQPPSFEFYPQIPDGYEYFDNIDDLRIYLLSTFTQQINIFSRSKIIDPKFNNPDVGDYSLAFDSPAKNLSYFGTFVGTQSIGYSIKAKTIESQGDFDFSTAINISIQDNSIQFIDDSQIAQIETKVKPNLIARELGKAPIFGFNADRNGQYIDSIEDLSNITISAGILLNQNTPYIVEIGAITYNGEVYQPGERLVTTTEQSFTTDAGGICREITEAPQRHTLMARFYDGGLTKVAGDNLTLGWWYYVTGTITYNGTDYTNEVFKAIDNNSFTGSGTAREAMTNQAYQHYEYGIKFTSNNVGDTRTGAIVRGNGDPDYERGTGKEFPINARFIQIKYILRPNNLKP